MKKNIFLIFLLAVALYASALEKPEYSRTIKGSVQCNGKAVAGVPVTDGYSMVLTDKNGKYSLPLASASRFVYLSSPSGYTVETENSTPQFFQPVPAGKQRKNTVDFQLKKAPADDTNHAFVVWADPQVKTIKELQQAKEVANDLKELTARQGNYNFHGLGCGDIVGDNPALYDSIKNMLAGTEIPFYQSIGNHDLHYNMRSDDASSSVYQDNFGPDYYSFNRGDIHYVVLNDVFYIGRDYFYIGYIPETQLAWLEKDLSFVDSTKTIVVALHIPTALNDDDLKQFSYSYISKSVANKSALYKILAPYTAHIISGHMHASNNIVISPKLFEHNISSVCGAWWQGPYAEDGTPKGYAVFEANGTELTWYYKSSGHDKDFQFTACPVGKNPEQPEYFTVNVWNWDPLWKVCWYENGVKVGEMEQYEGRDPATTAAYADKEKLDYKWLTSAVTTHLFKAKPRNASAKITIEVTDRFGNSFKKDL
ncbi:calcineurin-like phosphoesterase family protein [Maribellus sp. YY47]|uniref:calcineurin-like phosphoesterase C-terminal domain-containing protein n=1 Tax=Maribellus sp. YY47 TaxID=2929486 RepID=UPI002001B519|nr:calcineurin-like phosphoesterase family protein [Maribellus sp. YY47]MCK3685616.1 calcineurin-like phosphoesterase family protein [Maribellus sp. YY47]